MYQDVHIMCLSTWLTRISMHYFTRIHCIQIITMALNLNLNLKKCLLDKKQIQAGNNVINDTYRVFYVGRPLQRRWAHRWRKSHPNILRCMNRHRAHEVLTFWEHEFGICNQNESTPLGNAPSRHTCWLYTKRNYRWKGSTDVDNGIWYFIIFVCIFCLSSIENVSYMLASKAKRPTTTEKLRSSGWLPWSSRWKLPWTSTVRAKAVTMTTFPFQWLYRQKRWYR